jgi:hypothetical protein
MQMQQTQPWAEIHNLLTRFEMLTAVKVGRLDGEVVWTCRSIPTFRTNILPTSSVLKILVMDLKRPTSKYHIYNLQ